MEINKRKIIVREAQSFYNSKIKKSNGAYPNLAKGIFLFEEMEKHLIYLYTSENKAIFLQEIQKQINQEVEIHQKQAHNGLRGKNCTFENVREELTFYVQQELNELPLVADTSKITSEKRTKIYISYSPEDIDMREKIEDALRSVPKEYETKIDIWDNTYIKAGQDWKKEIKKRLLETKIAILLISRDFLASKFIRENELLPLLKAAKDDNATILWVLLKPCNYKRWKEITQYEPVNRPMLSFSEMELNQQDTLLVNLTDVVFDYLNAK